MRGFTVVLYVAVLLSLLNGALAACGANGDQSPSTASICICKSGYSGAACDVLASECAAGEQAVQPAADVADNFPRLNKTEGATEFKGNNLYATIFGEHVANRTYLELNFTDSYTNEKCSFGTDGSYWTMDFGCNDRFNLILPWVEHTSCGFHNDTTSTNAEFLFITNTLHIAYEDWVYIDMGMDENNVSESYLLARRVSIPYRMSVKFQKYINVQLLALNITSDVKFGAALTGDEFDPVTGILTLTLTTIINYPNSFKGHQDFMTLFTPSHVIPQNYSHIDADTLEEFNDGHILFKNIVGIQEVCNYQNTMPCTQVWEVQLKTDNCTFDGQYSLIMTLYTCRSTKSYQDQACTNTLANITFSISTNDVCGSIDITPVVTGQLVPFKYGVSIESDVDAGPPVAAQKKTFKLGEYGNFFASIVSDGNDIKINFTDIRFKAKDASNDSWVYLMRDKVLNETHSLAQVVPHHASKYFTVYFHSSVFPVPPTQKIVYTFSAYVDILFFGNEGEQKKRSVEYTFETNTLAAEANVFLASSNAAVLPTVGDKSVVEQGEGVNQTTFIAAVVGAIAGTMIIVFVVVGVALRSRKQSSSRDAAASAAVVAANAAAQSIEVVSRV